MTNGLAWLAELICFLCGLQLQLKLLPGQRVAACLSPNIPQLWRRTGRKVAELKNCFIVWEPFHWLANLRCFCLESRALGSKLLIIIIGWLMIWELGVWQRRPWKVTRPGHWAAQVRLWRFGAGVRASCNTSWPHRCQFSNLITHVNQLPGNYQINTTGCSPTTKAATDSIINTVSKPGMYSAIAALELTECKRPLTFGCKWHSG